MALYTFFLHDGPETMPRFEIEWMEDAEAAKAHARRLLQSRPHYTAVAIAEDGVEIDRVSRQNA